MKSGHLIIDSKCKNQSISPWIVDSTDLSPLNFKSKLQRSSTISVQTEKPQIEHPRKKSISLCLARKISAVASIVHKQTDNKNVIPKLTAALKITDLNRTIDQFTFDPKPTKYLDKRHLLIRSLFQRRINKSTQNPQQTKSRMEQTLESAIKRTITPSLGSVISYPSRRFSKRDFRARALSVQLQI